MFWSEHKRMLRDSVFLPVLLVFVCVNGMMIFWGEYTRTSWNELSAQNYKRVFQEIAQYDERQLREITEVIQNGQLKEYDVDMDTNTYRMLSRELAYVGDFTDYYEQKEEEYRLKTSVSIFGKLEGYQKRSAEKALRRLRRFCGTKITAAPSRGVKLVFENFATDVLILFLLLAAMVMFFLRDKERGVVDFIKTTYQGRGHFILSKLGSFLLLTAETVVLMYSSNLLCGWYIYGLGDMNRSLQSVRGYIGTGIGGTVWEAMLLFLLYKWLILSLVVMLLLLFMVLCRRNIEVYLALLAVFSLSGLCYYGIDANSRLSVLKNMNLVAFLHTGRVFSSDQNICFFGYPAPYQNLILIITLSSLLILPWMIVTVFQRQKRTADISVRAGRGWSFPWKRERIVVRSFFAQECKKIFQKERIAVLLAAFFAVIIASYEPQASIYHTESDVFYKDYIDQIQGGCTDEKQVQVLKWKNEIDAARLQMREEMEQAGDFQMQDIRNKYSSVLQMSEAAEQLYIHAAYIKGLDGGAFFYDRGFQKLTGAEEAGNDDALHALKCLVVMIILLAGVYSRDYVSGMYPLIHSTGKGRGRLQASRVLYGLFVSTIVFLSVYGSWYYSIFDAYGTAGLDSCVVSMEHIAKIFHSFSVREYLIFVNAVRFMGFLMVAFAAMVLSGKVRSMVMLVIVLLGIFVLPLLLYLLGFDFLKMAAFNPLFLGNLN